MNWKLIISFNLSKIRKNLLPFTFATLKISSASKQLFCYALRRLHTFNGPRRLRTLLNNICWTCWPFSFAIPTRPVPDNFEVKDKKRKMYPRGLWNSCVEPQKQHFIRGTIHYSDQQYMGEFKWEALCEGKAKEICLVPGPFLLFTILSWVTLMWTRWLKNKALWLNLIPAENRFVRRVGGMGKRRVRTLSHKTHKKITFQPVYQSTKERKGKEEWGKREGEVEI